MSENEAREKAWLAYSGERADAHASYAGDFNAGYDAAKAEPVTIEREALIEAASILMQKHYLDPQSAKHSPDNHSSCVCGRWSEGEMEPGWDDHLAEELADAGFLAAQPVTGTVETEAVKTTRQLHELCQSTTLSMDQALHASGLVQRLIDAEQERDAALAVIEQVRALSKRARPSTVSGNLIADGNALARIVATSSPDALDAAKADVWDEGYTVGNRHNGRRDDNPYRKENPNG